MKRMLVGFAAVFLMASSALAAVPWKTTQTSAGTIWINQSGMTLYTFDRDQKKKSSCYGQCAVVWPPFRAAATAKATGDWTVIKRKDGSRMWAYGGHPLYTYIKDKKRGQVAGDGVYQFGALWHVAKPGLKSGRDGAFKPKSPGSYKSMNRY